MRVSPVYLNIVKNSNLKRQTSVINFDGKTINSHYYTDREYIDAMKYKDQGPVSCLDFSDRYGFFEYVFTKKAEKHANEVNKCIEDIKIEELRAQKAKEAKQRKFKREQKALQAQINAIKKQNKNDEKVINSYTNIKKSEGLRKCNLSEENLEILKDEVLRPIAESKLNKDLYSLVPNGILINGKDESHNEKVVTELAKKILKEDYPHYFKKVQYINPEQFQDALVSIKNDAAIKYTDKDKLSIIYIPCFDNIAKYPGNDDYNPELNSFLKVYFLNCAQNGSIILASAIDKDEIEPPFLINSERFKVIVDI